MSNEVINYDDKKTIETLKATVALGATDEEFRMFAEICKATGLNPFKKEIWFIKTKGYTKNDGTQVPGKVQIMTGIMGYLSIANSHPQFDGMECEIERDKEGKPLRAIAKVWRKDRKFPSVGEAMWSEYYQKGQEYKGQYKPSVWDQKPSIMISKVAKSIALREAFSQQLSGTYTEDEMPIEYGAPKEEPKTATPPKPEPKKLEAPKSEVTLYDVKEPTRDQLLFFEKRGVVQDPETLYWVSPKDLGPKLEKFKVTVAEDDLPDEWKDRVEEANI